MSFAIVTSSTLAVEHFQWKDYPYFLYPPLPLVYSTGLWWLSTFFSPRYPMDAELTTTSLGYSLKNIPVPSRKEYKKQLIEKTQDVTKRMRWKAFHFLKGAEDRDDDEDDRDSNKETYGFKSRKCPPRIDEMKARTTCTV